MDKRQDLGWDVRADDDTGSGAEAGPPSLFTGIDMDLDVVRVECGRGAPADRTWICLLYTSRCV